MASIKRRGNTYQFRVSDGFDTEGKRIFRTMTFTPKAKEGTKAYDKEIADAARDFEKMVKEGKYLTGENLTFQAVAVQWKEQWAAKSLSDKGDDYMKIIKARAYPAFGSMKISKIMPLHVQTMINEMEKEGLAPATIHRDIVAINSVFRFAYRMKIIQENPCDRCELPKHKADTALHYFTKEQAMTFLNKALTMEYKDTYKGHTRTDDTGKQYEVKSYTEVHRIPLQFRVLYTLAIYGGFRRGELGALTWNDINEVNHTISINKAAALRKGGYIIKGTKTEKGNRIVTMPAICFDLLREWRSEQLKLRFKLGTAWEGCEDFNDGFIFITATGKMMDLHTIGKKFQEILERYNKTCKNEADKLPIIRMHDLRHTSPTLLIAAGCDIATVSRRLGHSKISTTLDIYTHATEENDVKASQILEEMMVFEA